MFQQQFLNAASAQLTYMSTDELREIFADDDKLDERTDQILKPLENEKDVIITENRTLAESNLEQEPKLIEMRSIINELSREFRNLSENVQVKLTQLKSSSLTTDPESVLARLQASAAESEEKSDQLAEGFFENNIPTDEFLEQFKVSRAEMHLRKLKAEKMQELLRQTSRQSGGPGMYQSNFYGPGPGTSPYPNIPSMQFPMPMPAPPMMRPPF